VSSSSFLPQWFVTSNKNITKFTIVRSFVTEDSLIAIPFNMKILSIATLLIVIAGAAAFSPQQQRQQRVTTSSSLQAQPTSNHNKNWWAPTLTAAIGWTLASQVALAAPGTMSMDFVKPDEPIPTMSLDFSMPKYDSGKASVGFGLGNSVTLNSKGTASTMIDPGANEKEKQAAAMKKAEENRKVRMATEKAAKKEKELEYQQREAEKKLEKAERLKNIWN
jgi:hypothetical protein